MKKTVASIVIALTLIVARAAMGQTETTFTYQGTLDEGGVPVSGVVDIEVSLWDAATNGGQLGLSNTFDDHAIVDGSFTILLDFGSSVFNGDQRWLELSVDGVVLSPRQPLTVTPYSLQTRGLFVDALRRVGVGTGMPTSLLHLSSTSPVLTVQDSDSSGAAQSGFLSFKDNAGVQRGIVGYGSPTSSELSISNGLGDIRLSSIGGQTIVAGPATIQNQGDEALLLRFSTERSWEFRQDGAGSSTALKLMSVGGGGNKNVILQTDGSVLYNTLVGVTRARVTTNSVDAGAILAYGPNGNRNVSIGSTTQDRGAVWVVDENDTTQASIYVDPFDGEGRVSADVKNFRLPNPRKEGTEIVFACIEGPEAAAYVRGTATLVDGSCVVSLPEYFFDVATSDGMTVQVTPRSADSLGLAVVSQSVERFEVRELHNGRGSYEFHWEVKAVRRGYEHYRVIQDRLRW